MKRMIPFCAVTSLFLLTMALDGSASMIPITNEELILECRDIIHGIVTEVKSEWDENHSLIYSYVKFKILHVLKGEPRDEVIIQILGGNMDDTHFWVEDTPEFKENMEVIIHTFLIENGNLGIYGGDQGVYNVNDGVISNLSGELKMTLDQFKNLVDEVMKKSDFNFIFKYGVGARNELNTFENTFTKDLIGDPDTTVHFSLSKKELKRIHKKMTKIGFFDYPDTFSIRPGEIVCEKTPFVSYYFKVEYDSKIKVLWWENKIINYEKNKKAKNLMELIMFIRNLIESKEEYKKLPPPRGGYL